VGREDNVSLPPHRDHGAAPELPEDPEVPAAAPGAVDVDDELEVAAAAAAP